MGITILGITGFQLYWLQNNYEREKLSLELLTDASFRQTILELQASKLKLELLGFESDEHPFPGRPGFSVRKGKNNKADVQLASGQKPPPITMINLMQQKMKQYESDSNKKNSIIFSDREITDSALGLPGNRSHNRIRSITISATADSLIKLDPELIREVTVTSHKKDSGSGGRIMAIGYGNKSADKSKTDSFSVRKPEKIFEKKIPGLTEEDIVHQKSRINPPKDAVFRFLYNMDSIVIKDSVTIKEISNSYAAKLKESKMNLSFAVSRLDSGSYEDSTAMNEVTLGFAKPITYRLSIENKVSYLLKKLSFPILFSIFLVGVTIASFVLLYRGLLKQQRLADLKNQFISNITHELKTPIATVGVAIEALKNFNAIHDPERTREYLDISQNELQRLSLLVDKVLKLSMFENRELELKKEQFDCKLLVEEVMNSLKLQFDKYHTKVKLHTEGYNFIIEADKLHITSVIYNLLDNALKYSKENPVIDVQLSSYPEYIEFSVSDNGIGIEPAYREKIFDKFFRVPTGDKHNIKGYGLGLSYVAEVIKRHHGHVYAESEFGKGSTFTAKMPYKEVPVIRFDDKRSIRKEGKIL